MISVEIAQLPSGGTGFVEFLVEKGQHVALKETVDLAHSRDGDIVRVDLRIKKPNLWYPYSLGGQTLYTVTATLCSSNGQDQHKLSRGVGFRKAELIQQSDEAGKSFYLRINNTDIFAGGSNWIPADCFIPRISKERYRKWLEIIKEGGQHMIRYGIL